MRKSRDYWKNRALESEAWANKQAESEIVRQQKLYRAAYKEIGKSIDDLYIEVVNLGIEPSRTQLWQLTKHLALEEQIGKSIGKVVSSQRVSTEKVLIKIFEQTTNTTIGQLQKSGGLHINARWNLIDESQVRQYVNTAWNNHSFSKIYERNGIDIAARIKGDISKMLLEGKSPADLKKALQADLNMNYYAADRLVRTEASHFYNDAAMRSYKAAGLNRVEYIGEQDDAICEECEENVTTNGGVYEVGQEPSIPVHPNCRCCYAGVVEFDEEVV